MTYSIKLYIVWSIYESADKKISQQIWNDKNEGLKQENIGYKGSLDR